MIHFGTGGWRAVIGDEFTKSNIQLLAKAMVEKMKHEGVSDQVTAAFWPRKRCSGWRKYLRRKGFLQNSSTAPARHRWSCFMCSRRDFLME